MMTRPMAKRPTIIVTEEMSDAPMAWLAERAEVVRAGVDDPAFDDAADRAVGLVIRTYTKVDDALLDRLPRLRVVGRAGVGLDNVDQDACERRGVAVRNTPNANTHAVVEFVVACIFDALRPRLFLDRAIDKGEWRRLRGELIAEREVRESTIGVYGVGKIGREMCRVASGLGMTVLGHDLKEIDLPGEWNVEMVSREEVLERSHIVSLHVDDAETNRAIINADAVGRMRSDVLFINTARGHIVDAHALADFMIGHPAAQAILDVHDPEPFGADYPLLDIKNVHLSPHIGAGTRSAKENMSWVVRDVWGVVGGSGESRVGSRRE